MSVTDLNRAQLDELKQAYLFERSGGEPLSWGEIAQASDEISDADVILYYDGVVFSSDDFSY